MLELPLCNKGMYLPCVWESIWTWDLGRNQNLTKEFIKSFCLVTFSKEIAISTWNIQPKFGGSQIQASNPISLAVISRMKDMRDYIFAWALNSFSVFFFLASSIVQLTSIFSNSTVFRLISLSLNQCLTFTLFLYHSVFFVFCFYPDCLGVYSMVSNSNLV